MAKILTVYWRDIPTQIIAEDGKGRNRKKIKLELSKRFMISVDSSAMIANCQDSENYLQYWRKSEPTEISKNLEKEANLLKKNLEETYDNFRLKELVKNGGYERK